ncbi:hypothetical protein NGR_b12210 (plasmid) [Sinorhizobium fredii NGR234]|uniref:Uncharacterized protein n=1 Tax=Sinorhizobium fredii (strain NBRC 101917 / NGR234) TaxID=394 RepID=C3KRG6_SINFN|nr:hypothetical protein NGR_b12210 [Sinorhizobium fredii NGR234]
MYIARHCSFIFYHVFGGAASRNSQLARNSALSKGHSALVAIWQMHLGKPESAAGRALGKSVQQVDCQMKSSHSADNAPAVAPRGARGSTAPATLRIRLAVSGS